ncbi:hypothetical protein PDIG_36280 [Penicillium digitatum PHI26]|uniref:Uncharacterized protein n=2 Tax=Penicillium digitatum TaxID=36651 RepID=K9FYQ1_PEND2|nr:hypothetical protein PDIP_05200 [Penicillium digitatum Pd1]EKV13717.1 hypothetical protein PDIG_36280 [Penicillium digitatum PHI26]EKV21557.1 hypothetical protein PDIP_05200 [Penicillium digitatum Pd1]
MKKILPLKFKGTMRETMLKYYQEPTGTQHQIQRSENDFDQEQGSKEYGFWMAYRQLFLFAMRHFFGLTNVRPLALSSHRSKFETSELWRRFKSCARAIGFVLPGSNWPKDRNQGPFPSGYTLECAAIHQLITRLRPPELFSCDQAKFSETSGQIISLLSTITARKLSNIITPQTCEMIETWSVERRCGMPTADTFFHDQKYLFMHYIDATNQPAGVGMSSFAVKRDIFRSFFADFDDGSRMDETMAPVTMVSISEPLRDIPVSLELQQNLELKFR